MTTTTAPTAGDALVTATQKLQDLEAAKRKLDGEAVELAEAIGRAVADHATPSALRDLRAERDAVEQAREDAIYALRAVHRDVEHAEAAVRADARRKDARVLHQLADELQRAAEQYEAALAAPSLLKSRDAFMFVGRALVNELAQRGMTLQTGFNPERLAWDIYTQRTREASAHTNPDYDAPVPSFVAAVVRQVKEQAV